MYSRIRFPSQDRKKVKFPFELKLSIDEPLLSKDSFESSSILTIKEHPLVGKL